MKSMNAVWILLLCGAFSLSKKDDMVGKVGQAASRAWEKATDKLQQLSGRAATGVDNQTNYYLLVRFFKTEEEKQKDEPFYLLGPKASKVFDHKTGILEQAKNFVEGRKGLRSQIVPMQLPETLSKSTFILVKNIKNGQELLIEKPMLGNLTTQVGGGVAQNDFVKINNKTGGALLIEVTYTHKVLLKEKEESEFWLVARGKTVEIPFRKKMTVSIKTIKSKKSLETNLEDAQGVIVTDQYDTIEADACKIKGDVCEVK
jgi:hypothetical protein